MSYATTDDFIAYFGEDEARELTNLDDAMAIDVNGVLLQKALDHATAEVNVYLASNYTLPLISVPSILVYDTCEIARFRLDRYKTREDVTERYDKVIQRLRDISKGVVSLGLDQNSQEVSNDSGPGYISAPPVFTFHSLRDF